MNKFTRQYIRFRLCRAQCMPGYLFPEGFTELTIQCVRRTGEWSPDIGFPDCERKLRELIKFYRISTK